MPDTVTQVYHSMSDFGWEFVNGGRRNLAHIERVRAARSGTLPAVDPPSRWSRFLRWLGLA